MLSGNSSVLEADFFPPIVLDNQFQYECGLIDFQTFNCIPNVDEINNSFVYNLRNETKVICLPIGSYEIEDIYLYIKSKLDDGVFFDLYLNKNTLKCEITSAVSIDFTQSNSIGNLLGYSARMLEADKKHISDKPVDINRINTIRVECSIITGSYLNNESVHTLHEFFPSVEAGYKISETPQNVIYLPVTVSTIRNICVRFVDQNSHLINFRGENIVTRLHIRKVRN